MVTDYTVKRSVSTREFNLEAYAAITWHNDPASLGLKPRLAVHRSQAARTATLPIAPPRQAMLATVAYITNIIVIHNFIYMCIYIYIYTQKQLHIYIIIILFMQII